MIASSVILNTLNVQQGVGDSSGQTLSEHLSPTVPDASVSPRIVSIATIVESTQADHLGLFSLTLLMSRGTTDNARTQHPTLQSRKILSVLPVIVCPLVVVASQK